MAGHGMGPQGLGTCHSTLTLGCTNSALITHTLLTNALLWLSHTPDGSNERIPACPHFPSLTTCSKCAFPSRPGPVPPHSLEPTSHLNTSCTHKVQGCLLLRPSIPHYVPPTDFCSACTPQLPSIPTYPFPLAFCSPSLSVSRISTGFLASTKSNTR